MKQLAAQADARWASKASFLDAPAKKAPAEQVPESTGICETNQAATPSQDEAKQEDKFKGKVRAKEPHPLAKAQQGGPGESWQPQSWTPNVASKR